MIPIVLSVLGLDRITKMLVASGMELGDSIPVISGYFELTYVHNTGAAFGILGMMDEAYRVPFFAVTTLLALGLMGFLARQADPSDRWLVVALSFIMGGAAGNLVDRLIYGYVVDFVDWHVGLRHWPAFNVADSAITVGMVLLGFVIIFGKSTGGRTREGTDEG